MPVDRGVGAAAGLVEVESGGVVPGVFPGVDEGVVVALGEVYVGESGGAAVGGGDVVAVEFGEDGVVAVCVVAVGGDDVEAVAGFSGWQGVRGVVDPGAGSGEGAGGEAQ